MPYHKVKTQLNVVIAEGAAYKNQPVIEKKLPWIWIKNVLSILNLKVYQWFSPSLFLSTHPPRSNVGINQGIYFK